jgi:hypothetical protein
MVLDWQVLVPSGHSENGSDSWSITGARFPVNIEIQALDHVNGRISEIAQAADAVKAGNPVKASVPI